MAQWYEAVDSSKKQRLGTRKRDVAGREFIYLKGVSSLVAKDAVTYDEAGVTALLTDDQIGPVAIAMATVDASTKYGWFGIFGTFTANGVASSSDNATVGKETTAGKLGDGRDAGDEILGCVARSATTDAGDLTVQINYPWVNDKTGS